MHTMKESLSARLHIDGPLKKIREVVNHAGNKLAPLDESHEFEEFAMMLSSGELPEDHPYYGIPTGGHISDLSYSNSGRVGMAIYEVQQNGQDFQYVLTSNPDDGIGVMPLAVWIDNQHSNS